MPYIGDMFCIFDNRFVNLAEIHAFSVGLFAHLEKKQYFCSMNTLISDILNSHLYIASVSIVTTCMFIAAGYLLFSRRNAWGEEIIPNQRLRRQAGYTTLAIAGSYVFLLLCILCVQDVETMLFCSATFDAIVTYPLILRFLLALLQDKQRWRKWCSAAFLLFLVPLIGWFCSHNIWWAYIHATMLLVVLAGFVVYYLLAIRHYRRFLLDYYADIEYKEVGWSLGIILMFLLFNIPYLLIAKNPYMGYVFYGCEIAFIGFLVVHIDKQQVLENIASDEGDEADNMEPGDKLGEEISNQSAKLDNQQMEQLSQALFIHCEKTCLYLQYDLTLNVLAKACGTNRTYLGLYFTAKGTTYNAYINGLRIAHFQALYRLTLQKETSSRPILQKLAAESGFRSYNTFTRAFCAYTGMSLKDWIEVPSN